MTTRVYQNLKEKYGGKKVLVVGLGLLGGGVGVARFFAELGSKVTITDKKTEKQLSQSINQLKQLSITFHLGGHQLEDFLDPDVIFKGPFVPWDLPHIIAAGKKGIPVEMELSFVAQHSPAPVIGVTGTRGKSTTTMMIWEILKANKFPAYLGGSLPNISTINYLKTLTNKDWLLMELPSWPLSDFHRKKISPHIAIFTNFYPDHLNYYKDMDDYLYDKKAIYLYQKPDDYLIVNENLENIISPDKPKGQVRYFRSEDFTGQLTYLKGEHNRQNAAAALAVTNVLKIDPLQCFKTLKSFRGLPFRQEIVGEKGHITFVNDTTSTTPVATQTALTALKDRNIILILGGNSKNLPTADLVNYLTKTKKIVLLAGSFTDEILPQLKEKYSKKITRIFDNLEKAINESYKLAKEFQDEVFILFSPAATSFAMFNNEFHRGEEFNRIVKKLINR